MLTLLSRRKDNKKAGNKTTRFPKNKRKFKKTLFRSQLGHLQNPVWVIDQTHGIASTLSIC